MKWKGCQWRRHFEKDRVGGRVLYRASHYSLLGVINAWTTVSNTRSLSDWPWLYLFFFLLSGSYEV